MAAFSSQSLPADYFVKAHQFTNTVHRDQYPSIDPTSFELSQKGKTVIVTGASQGISKVSVSPHSRVGYARAHVTPRQAIALAFAKADAARIVIASRRVAKLEETKKELLQINPNVDVLILQTDITSEDSVDRLEETVKSKFGIPDVLVNAVGSWSSSENLGNTNPKEWWADFVRHSYSSFSVI